MKPVEKLNEKVAALSLALHFLASAERHAPAAALAGAKRILAALRALEIGK